MSKQTTSINVTVIYVVEVPGKGVATVTTGDKPFNLEVPASMSPTGIGYALLLDACEDIQESAKHLRNR